MKTFKLVLAAILAAVVAPAIASDSRYDNQYEFADSAKAIDVANARLADSNNAYNDQYEYAATARAADLALTANSAPSNPCAGQPACVSTNVRLTTSKSALR